MNRLIRPTGHDARRASLCASELATVGPCPRAPCQPESHQGLLRITSQSPEELFFEKKGLVFEEGKTLVLEDAFAVMPQLNPVTIRVVDDRGQGKLTLCIPKEIADAMSRYLRPAGSKTSAGKDR